MEKKKRNSGYFDTDPQAETQAKPCAHAGCGHAGEYRAPKSRQQLHEYLWFCLDHVREYNLQWNYYAGMNETEVEERRRHETVWERPSWPFGSKAHYKKFRAAFDRKWGEFASSFGIFEEDNENYRSTHSSQAPMDHQTVRAFNTLGLTPPLDFDSVKREYKSLVKKFHPDLHGGNKDAEERFKTINEAFQTIKRAFGGTV